MAILSHFKAPLDRPPFQEILATQELLHKSTKYDESHEKDKRGRSFTWTSLERAIENLIFMWAQLLIILWNLLPVNVISLTCAIFNECFWGLLTPLFRLHSKKWYLCVLTFKHSLAPIKGKFPHYGDSVTGSFHGNIAAFVWSCWCACREC